MGRTDINSDVSGPLRNALANASLVNSIIRSSSILLTNPNTDNILVEETQFLKLGGHAILCSIPNDPISGDKRLMKINSLPSTFIESDILTLLYNKDETLVPCIYLNVTGYHSGQLFQAIIMKRQDYDMGSIVDQRLLEIAEFSKCTSQLYQGTAISHENGYCSIDLATPNLVGGLNGDINVFLLF
jgi:hypothetical protein